MIAVPGEMLLGSHCPEALQMFSAVAELPCAPLQEEIFSCTSNEVKSTSQPGRFEHFADFSTGIPRIKPTSTDLRKFEIQPPCHPTSTDMPNNRKVTLKKVKGKDGVHPGSRKAGQITRAHLRTAKLASQGKVRKDENKAKCEFLIMAKLTVVFRPNFFLRVVSSPEPLSLQQLRALITDAYISRNDERIAELIAERRPGRPKEKELINLEELKRSELQEWATGFGKLRCCVPAHMTQVENAKLTFRGA